MYVEKYPLDVKASVAAGDALDVRSMGRKTVFVNTNADSTLQVEISSDGTVWHSKGTPFTSATGFVEITEPCMFVRVNTTVFGSGTPAADLVGIVNNG